jgi:hypothetical protein
LGLKCIRLSAKYLQNTVSDKKIFICGTTRGISLVFEDMLASQEKLYVAEDRV